jgi:hypothetical protein
VLLLALFGGARARASGLGFSFLLGRVALGIAIVLLSFTSRTTSSRPAIVPPSCQPNTLSSARRFPHKPLPIRPHHNGFAL